MENVLHEPKIIYYFRHASGIDIDIAITTNNGWKMTLLPDVDWVRKLIKKINLSVSDMERVHEVEDSNTKRLTMGTCCNEDCESPSDGIDRGRPLCESCFSNQSRITENMADRFHIPKEMDIESNDTYGILFG